MALRRRIAAVIVVVALMGILPFVVASRSTGSSIVPPSSITDPSDPAQRSAVLAYARSLKFDDYTHGAYGENLLDTLGTVGRIYPEVHSDRTLRERFPHGRIYVRVEIAPGRKNSSVGYRSFPPGTSYVWVDDLSDVGDSGTVRGIIIPADPMLPTTVVAIQVHPGVRVDVPLARWTDKSQCWSCTKPGSWCQGT